MPKETKPERLRRLIARIEDQVGYDHHALMAELGAEKATFQFSGGTHVVRLAGVGASATPGYADALRNWCNAARRELNRLEAA